jgi:hypothetical protein
LLFPEGFVGSEIDPSIRWDLGDVEMKHKVWLALLVVPVVAFGLVSNVAADQGGGELDLTAVLTPVPGSDLRGTAEVTINLGTSILCWDLEYTTTEQVTAAHIHEGAAGVNGPIVFGFFNTINEGCRSGAPALLAKIAAHPGNYYVNVHTIKHAGGASRGQLTIPGEED